MAVYICEFLVVMTIMRYHSDKHACTGIMRRVPDHIIGGAGTVVAINQKVTLEKSR